ncbi:MAG: class IV adenylate cyclase [Candidatus Thermoplasmatota archaeon]|jgi:adenylate cyclase class 2|nr:class IV adenylate cyclase [Candidatus Thermoplasmatota archaeon]
MQLEVEIKTRLRGSERSEIHVFLSNHGAVLLSETIEKDIYFNSRLVDFRKTDEALRLRRTRAISDLNDGEMDLLFLTYKGPKIDENSKTRREINIELDKDQAKSLTEIFKSLGFHKSGMVIKTRTQMSYNGFVICLDIVEGLGDFMEIEKIVSDGELLEGIVEKMKSLLPGTEEKEWIRESYLEMCVKGGK